MMETRPFVIRREGATLIAKLHHVPVFRGEDSRPMVEEIRRLVTDELKGVIIDMAEVESMNSMALGDLLGLGAGLRSRGLRLVLAGLTNRVRDVILVVKVESLMPSYTTLDAAKAAVASQQ